MRFIGRGNKNQQFVPIDDIEMSLLKVSAFREEHLGGVRCRRETASGH